MSIDEVRTLVGERQRYDDWLAALESRRAETPERVFERVHGDYLARRRDVLTRLREHVGGLSSTTRDLESRLSALDVRLGALEDERAEAMLRTAVGEYDSERWERVRQDVEAQIAELGGERTTVMTELDEVRSLLTSASSEPDPDNAAAPDESVDAPEAEPLTSAEFTTDDATEAAVVEADPSTTADWPVAAPTQETLANVDQALPGVAATSAGGAPSATVESASASASDVPTALTSDLTADSELADLDNALALFSSEGKPDGFSPGSGSAVGSAPTGLPTALDGVDVFDDAELGDLRMAPPARSVATATPPASPVSGMNGAASPAADATRDGFDDLAFLRSVVDAGAPTGAVRGPASGEQQKTLRCTECGTMNLPTEWYCERCGGELAAF